MHLRNGNLWTTVDTPESYDHDKLLSVCDIHLVYTGNGQFIELKCKVEPRINISITSNTATTSTSSATGSANESDRNISTTPVSRVIGTIKSDLDTLAILLSRTPQSIHVSTLSDTSKPSLIKPSLVKLRKLSKTDIQLWTSTKTLTKSKDPLNATFLPIKTKKTAIASASHKPLNQTRRKLLHGTSSNKLASVRFRTINKFTRCKTASPKPSSRTTRAQKIQHSGTKSPTFKISVQGLKRYKHRYSYKCMVNPCNRRFATVRDWN